MKYWSVKMLVFYMWLFGKIDFSYWMLCVFHGGILSKFFDYNERRARKNSNLNAKRGSRALSTFFWMLQSCSVSLVYERIVTKVNYVGPIRTKLTHCNQWATKEIQNRFLVIACQTYLSHLDLLLSENSKYPHCGGRQRVKGVDGTQRGFWVEGKEI